MKKLFTFGILAFFSLAAIMAWTLPEDTRWKEKVDQALLDKAALSDQLDFTILLTEMADVSASTELETKNEKAQFVYDKLKETATNTQTGIINLLASRNITHHSFYIINSIQIIGDIALVQELAERPEVSRIMDNPTMLLRQLEKESIATERDPDPVEWGVEKIRAEEVWNLGYTGQGVVVGVADTGDEWDHPALINKYRGWNGSSANHSYNWHDAIHSINPLNGDLDPSNNPCGVNSVVPCDDNDHGTHVVGIAVGSDGENDRIGVAPDAKWIACRNMERGYGSPTSYVECLEWFLAPTNINNQNPDPTKAPHVICNSWSCPEMEGCNPNNWSLIEMAINNLKSSGVVVIAAAGNNGVNGCSSISAPPAIFENSLTIGATNVNDEITNFSSTGPIIADNSSRMKPNVVAPGREIRSAVRGGEYEAWQGTSMAAPHVAGLVALLVSADPSLAGQVERIEDIIESTAIPLTSDEGCGGDDNVAVPNNIYGFGRVDALAAVDLALQTSSVSGINNETIIKAFPNPITDLVQFEIQNVQGIARLEIFNTSGQMIISKQIDIINAYQIESISMADLPHGIYFYKITNETASFGGKLIKK